MKQENDIFLENSLAQKGVNLRLTSEEKNNLKKPFRKAGIFIIIISVICLILLIQIPWIYVNYDSDSNESVEEVIYNNPNNQEFEEDSFFESVNGSQNIGIFLEDFSNTYTISLVILIGLLAIGILVTLYQIITRDQLHYYELDIVINSIALVLTSIICICLIYIFIKFISAHFLNLHNSSYILDKFPNINIILPLPFIIIIIMAVLLKVSFTLLKINIIELEKINKPDFKEKAIYSYKKVI